MKVDLTYNCRHCNSENKITSFRQWFWTPHFGTKKRIRCKTCGKVSYMKRRDGRKILDWYTEKK